MTLARQLPVLENPQATEIRYLFHFSDANDIKAFDARPETYCWADVFSAEISIIDRITNAPNPADYKSIYILRIGLPSTEPDPEIFQSDLIGDWVRGYPGTCREYGLAKAIQPGQFGRVDINLDPTRSFFLP